MVSARSPSSAKPRQSEIDALRGLAAILVVLFHYTTRFDQLYGHHGVPVVSVPWGHYGVNLFFLISGYVIYMTLERTSAAGDFLVSRFSRLYPAFWASILLTYGFISWLGLPGKEVAWSTMLFNFAMFHGVFKVPHVDGVYWTLEIELIFYGLVLIAFNQGWLERIHRFLMSLLLVRVAYFVFAHYFGIELPWMVGHLLIIKYIPWFSIGIMIYRLASGRETVRQDFAVIAVSVAILTHDSILLGAICLGLSSILYLAALGKLTFLRWALLVWLGEISYTLYLLHENIGWAVMLRLQQFDLGANLTIATALLLSIFLAALVTAVVERPAMRWLRQAYRSYSAR